MKIKDFAVMGFKNLWRRKLRTILTAVGVAIGTFSIVIMLSLGIAMTEGYKNQLAEWGNLTKITVNRYGYYYDEESGMGVSNEQKLDDTLIQTLSQIEHVRAVTPILNIQSRLKSGKYEAWCSITGINPETLQYFDFPEVASGEYISDDNPTALLFGKDSCYFYNPRGNGNWSNNDSPVDLMNDQIKITFDGIYDSTSKTPKYSKLNVAGVMAENDMEMNYSVYAPIKQVEEWYKKYNPQYKKKKELSYESIWVSVDDVDNVKQVQDQIKSMGYSTYSMADNLDDVQEISNTLQLILGGIGAVSLLVSAIGIANTMIMSIYERTKEIGVMKVLGCVVTDIRKLFLFEASIIGLLGGTIGLVLSYGVSYVLNEYAPEIGGMIGLSSEQAISIIPIWLALSALGFAILIGVISGLYPAKKATKIRAIEAMRTEG